MKGGAESKSDIKFLIYNTSIENITTSQFLPRNDTKNELARSHGLLIEHGPICHIVKFPISMIRPFSLVNNSHITLYPQLEIIWKVSKSFRKYWGKYGQISCYIISCITRDCIIVENIFLV